ncbi:MAG: 50S ribosomal protein L15 [Candidatus Hydrogenedens sp.]|nr:50S ribosomal protein L15 [Candidatus Hydrogenedens sp.]
MELHSLKSAPKARKNRKRVGRGHGSGWGKTAGRGHGGQKSRAGYSQRAGFEGGQMPLSRRLPKRGFYHRKRFPLAGVNLDVLNERYEDGAEITSETLQADKLVKIERGGVKLLGRGEVQKRFVIKVQAASASAIKKVQDAGGEVVFVSFDPVEAAEAAELAKAVEVAEAAEVAEVTEVPDVAEAAEVAEVPEVPEVAEDAETVVEETDTQE